MGIERDMGPGAKILLLSNSTMHGENYLAHAEPYIKEFFTKSHVDRVLFIPYALTDMDGYAEVAKKAFMRMGIEMDSIHTFSDPHWAAEKATGFFIGGGNTFLLLKKLYDADIIEIIRRRVTENGIPYIGSSAGTNVATVSINTTNDMPIVQPPSFRAIGLVPFNINPHYVDPDPTSRHMGETREKRINQYHEIPDTPPVLCMREGCILKVEGGKAELLGLNGARLLIRDEAPQEFPIGADVSFLLPTEIGIGGAARK